MMSLSDMSEIKIAPASPIAPRFLVGYLLSRAAWVDTGYFGYFVRKYLEASIVGCVLIGELNPRIVNLGFLDGVNFVECTPRHLPLVLKKFNYGCDYEQLSSRALLMIEKNHSAQVRAQQILSALNKGAILKYAKFESGKYIECMFQQET